MAEGNGSELAGLAQAILLDDPGFLRGIVERALQAILEEEMTAHLGAARYERGEGRTGYRNGAKPRTLTTRVGTLELRVPQDRDGTFSTELFARYQRSEQALVTTLMEMYLQGVSTRKVAAITEAAVRDGRLQEPGLGPGRAAGPGADGVAGAAADGGGLPLPGRRRPLRARAGGRAGGQRWGSWSWPGCATTGGGRSWRWRRPTPRARRPTTSSSSG